VVRVTKRQVLFDVQSFRTLFFSSYFSQQIKDGIRCYNASKMSYKGPRFDFCDTSQPYKSNLDKQFLAHLSREIMMCHQNSGQEVLWVKLLLEGRLSYITIRTTESLKLGQPQISIRE